MDQFPTLTCRTLGNPSVAYFLFRDLWRKWLLAVGRAHRIKGKREEPKESTWDCMLGGCKLSTSGLTLFLPLPCSLGVSSHYVVALRFDLSLPGRAQEQARKASLRLTLKAAEDRATSVTFPQIFCATLAVKLTYLVETRLFFIGITEVEADRETGIQVCQEAQITTYMRMT